MIAESSSRKRRILRAVWVVVVIALISAAVAATWVVKPTRGAAEGVAPPEVAGLEEMQRGLVWVAQTIEPSVVFIEAEQKVTQGGQEQSSDQGDGSQVPEPWRRFFGPGSPFPFSPPDQPSQPNLPAVGQGSGVIIDPAGYILTNNHVAGDAAKITVHLQDGESYPAQLVAADRLTDLAVIKIEPKRALTAAKLGDADAVKPGMWAIAIGYPFGGQGSTGYGGGGGRFDEPERYEPTLTVGVISATNRQIQSDIPGRPFRDLVQTDAPINPGNSGGPLVNIRAEVIGINQAIYTAAPFGGNIGVGFAIPVDARTKDIIARLKGGETIVRGQLGVLVKPLTPAVKGVYEAKSGVFVDSVQPDSPAARAQVKAEDIITSYNGKKVSSPDQFVSLVQATKPGTKVKVEVLRGGKTVSLEVTVGAYTPEVAEKKPTPSEPTKLGLTVEALPEGATRDLGITGGVRVRAVNPLSDGARAGLQPGDVIVGINREAVNDLADYRRVVGELKKGDPVVIRAWTRRNGSVTTFEIDRLSE